MRLLGNLRLYFGLGWVLSLIALFFVLNPVQAQRSPAQEKSNCYPFYSLPANIDITPLMTDTDGDRWIKVKVIGTGRIIVGYVKRNAQFCPAGEGKTNPET